jgi:hypothetical protein
MPAASRRHRRDRRPLVALAWLAIVLATERWYDWHKPIALQFGGDVSAYEQIARAAPSLPDQPLRTQHAQRFPVHWLVGSLADATGIGLHVVYWIAMGAALGALVLVTHMLLVRAGGGPQAYAICFGALVGSAYAFRFLLTVPGMVTDAVFLAGLALVVLSLVRNDFRLLVGGLALATLGRQTALPLVLLAVAWIATAPGPRVRRIVVAVAVPTVLYAVVAVVAASFAKNDFGSFSRFTIIGNLGEARTLAAHFGRAALGIAVPASLVAGAWIRSRRRPSRTAWGCAAAAGLVIVQPLVLGPAWVVSNEARLTALATPALVALAALALRDARLRSRETIGICAALAVGSFHHLYSRVDPGRAGWVALELAASAAVFGLLAWPRLVGTRKSKHVLS